MLPLKNCRKLWPLVALFLLSGCPRKDPAPCIEICINDGLGGADCAECGAPNKYRTPSEMENYVSTNPQDQLKYTSWCTGADPKEVQEKSKEVFDQIRGE